MTIANSQETVASGGNIATHTPVGSLKEYPTSVPVDALGHVIGSRPDFHIIFTPAANAANRILGDIFNTGTVPIRIRGVWIMPTFTAITGAPIDWLLQRTTAIGTGGAAVTPAPLDTNGTAWPAAATARSNPTAGATASTLIVPSYTFNEETNAAFGYLPYVNQLPQLGDRMSEIVLNQNQGFAIRQSAVANAVGLTGALVLAAFDN